MENMCIYVLNIDGLMMYTKPIICACFLKVLSRLNYRSTSNLRWVPELLLFSVQG